MFIVLQTHDDGGKLYDSGGKRVPLHVRISSFTAKQTNTIEKINFFFFAEATGETMTVNIGVNINRNNCVG